MDQNQSFGGPGRPMGLDRPSSSSSPSSSGISESPRESSIAFSLMASPTTRHHNLDSLSAIGKAEYPEEEEDADDDRDNETISIKAEPGESSTSITAAPAKRPRGRPRKLVKSEQPTSPKAVKGRSKTGCYTCRRRKKKCDERKPACKNCEQNNVLCEGYPARAVWRNGREKTVARNHERWRQSGPRPLPAFLHSVQEEIDWTFYRHYEDELSRRLNISPDTNNPFLKIVIPMALSHEGVMHALLSCSAAHYIHSLKGPEHEVEYRKVFERQIYHENKAIESMTAEEANPEDTQDPENKKGGHLMCRSLLFWLKNIVGGDSEGQWKVHEGYLSNLLKKEPQPGEEEAWKFAREFYQYHKMSSFITNADTPDFEEPPYLKLAEEYKDNFMSVCQGLENPTWKIHYLRKKIRERRKAEISPYVSYELIQEAEAIDAQLKQLQCRHEVGTEDWICWNLYHNCVWLLLQRTVMSGPHPTSNLLTTVGEALVYLASVGPKSPIQSVLVTPVFVVGCCAFNKDDRPAVLEAFDACEAYSHNGNIQHGRDIVTQLWKLMDAQDKKAWDYERVMKGMKIDTLIT